KPPTLYTPRRLDTPSGGRERRQAEAVADRHHLADVVEVMPDRLPLDEEARRLARPHAVEPRRVGLGNSRSGETGRTIGGNVDCPRIQRRRLDPALNPGVDGVEVVAERVEVERGCQLG